MDKQAEEIIKLYRKFKDGYITILELERAITFDVLEEYPLTDINGIVIKELIFDIIKLEKNNLKKLLTKFK